MVSIATMGMFQPCCGTGGGGGAPPVPTYIENKGSPDISVKVIKVRIVKPKIPVISIDIGEVRSDRITD